MRAASLAIPYECCRLGVSVVVNDSQDLASLLDRRIARMQTIEGNSKTEVIEPPATDVNGDAPKPLPRLADRRFRRM